MKVKRIAEMVQLERAVINMIWNDVKNTPEDNVWRNYERSFTYDNQKLKVKCSFMVDRQYFTYREMIISHDTQIIEIPSFVH